MADHGSLGALLQGVSQQPAHIRNDGQVTDQVNMVSDVVRGLTKRSGVSFISEMDIPTDLKFIDLNVGGQAYKLGYKAGYVSITDTDGVSQTLVVNDNALDYIGDDMAAYSYDDDIYITNRDVVVAKDATNTEAQDDVIKDVGLVMSLGGLFSHQYKVTVEYDDGYKAVGVYTAPSGLDTGDAKKTSSPDIVAALRDSLLNGTGITGYTEVEDGADTPIFTDNAAVKEGTTVTVEGSVLMIQGVTDIKITTEDGSGGDTLRSQTSKTKSTEELADLAPHGTLVKVIGLDDTEDDFWMRFEVDGETVVGNSFGSEGIWREWVNAYEAVAFDETTMPHVIEKTGDTEFTIGQGGWQPRRTGDENTNPVPSFVGDTIRDVHGFQSRLVFISGPNTIMSRTNIPSDFYAKSVVAQTATDPIDMLSTSEDENQLEWITSFDRDLVIFGNNAQFVVSGNSSLTPANASMTVTTGFKITNGIRPVSTGRTVLFPFVSGQYSGIKEMFSVNTDEANTAATLTRLQSKYLLGEVTNLVTSQDFSMTLVTMDGEGQENSVFVNQYLWDGQSKVQDAWYEWKFPHPVVGMFFETSNIVFTLNNGTALVQTRLSLDYTEEEVLGYPLCLDLNTKTYVTEDSDMLVNIDGELFVQSVYEDLVLVQAEGCYRPGARLKAKRTGSGPWLYNIDTETAPIGSHIYCGVPYRGLVTPTMPFIRDREGKVQRLAKLVVTDFVLHYDVSGFISTRMSSKYRAEDIDIHNDFTITENNLDDPNWNGIRSGEWLIPWGERSDWSQLTVYSDDFRPYSITELEWLGQPLTRGRRV